MGGRSRLTTSFTGSMIRCRRGIRGASSDLSASDARILKLLSAAQVASESRLQMAREASESRLQMALVELKKDLQKCIKDSAESSQWPTLILSMGIAISLGVFTNTVHRNMVH